MTRALVFRPEVEYELNEAVDWYQQHGTDLAARFLRAFEATLAAIERNPLQYQAVDGDVRHAVLRRFPYSIMYTVFEDDVTILACFHDRRDPARWRERH